MEDHLRLSQTICIRTHLTRGTGADRSSSYLQAKLEPGCIYTKQPQACPMCRCAPPGRPHEQKRARESTEKQNVVSPWLFCAREQVMAATSSIVAKKNLIRKCLSSNYNSFLQSNDLRFWRVIIKLFQEQFPFPKGFPFLSSPVYTWSFCYKKTWEEDNFQWLVH